MTTMRDTKYMLMKQCIKDAQYLYREAHRKSENIHSWRDYSTFVGFIGTSLFQERCKNPITQDEIKRIILAGEDAKQELETVFSARQELEEVIKTINKQEEELQKIKQQIENHENKIADYKAKHFLKQTVGDENFEQLQRSFMEVIGSNKCMYRIHKNGHITKFTQTRIKSGWKKSWSGHIQESPIPLDDAIATVYAHILSDADAFDDNKGCGSIYLRGVS